MIKKISANTVREAVRQITPYLEDTSSTGHKNIYYAGCKGLDTSAVLISIAQEPPPSLMNKFDKIIHVDCSKWKSRRALQRTIAQELQLPQGVMAIFDRRDEEDDFRGVDESSRAEIGDVSKEILRVLLDNKCLVLFHNGCDDIVEMNDFGIPPSWFGTKVLWTGMMKPWRRFYFYRLDDSHLYLMNELMDPNAFKSLLQEEAREIARYTCKLGATPEIAMECCLYVLSLTHSWHRDYNWAIHASNYWVCDGIIQARGQFDQTWEVASALHQHMDIQDGYIQDDPVSAFPYDAVVSPQKRWICASKCSRKDNVTLRRESTSVFLVGSDLPLASLPSDMFHQSGMLRVLRLYECTFSFSSPPFHCCHSLRFLGLDLCKDQPRGRDEKKDIPQVGFSQSLWVIDICNTDWEFHASPEITEETSTNFREIHIKKGRFFNFPWGQLRNLRKLRVIDPTCPWEIQVLPKLSRATSLKTLILDGCVGLKCVTGIPPSLESFSLSMPDAGRCYEEAQINWISLVGCRRMVDFTLRGSLPNLEKLDLSGTSVKTLDLSDHVVQAPRIPGVILLGCEQLRAVLWPREGMACLSELCIDTRRGRAEGEEVGGKFPDSKKLTPLQAYVAIADMRFIQSLVLQNDPHRLSGNITMVLPSCIGFCWNKDTIDLNLCLSATSTGRPSYNNLSLEERMAELRYLLTKLPPSKPVIPNPSCGAYPDIITNEITVDHNYNTAPQLQPSRCHVDIGEGISKTDAESVQAINPIIFVMNNAESLHVHDNSSITTVIPEKMMSLVDEKLEWRHLKQCRVERCAKMHTVFTINYDITCFHELESFCAVDLTMAHCIWRIGRTVAAKSNCSFAKLRSIHLYSCRRLAFVLPLSWSYNLTNLETIIIVSCDDLRQVFPVEAENLRDTATDRHKRVLEFSKLKHIYLHELYKLQHICEAKMFAPSLESVRFRGCWGLRRLPSVVQDSRPVVDCEKGWWKKLEWDGLEAGHDPSLFELHHSSYYKKPLPRVSVLM